MNSKIDLSPEERLAYEFAHRWRDENYRPNLQNIDWLHFAKLLTNNRMAVLAMQIFQRFNISIPSGAQELIREQAEKYERSASKLGQSLVSYLKSADAHGIKSIVLKGVWLCEKIYGVSSMRPGADIDILVRQNDVDHCLKL